MKDSRRHSGSVLASVLLVVILSAMVAASLMYRVRAEVSASVATHRRDAAQGAVRSGISFAVSVLRDASGDPLVWQDNPELFQDRFVTSDGVNDWYFSIYSPADSDSDQVRYGLTDEAGKIDLNTADEQRLALLPGMGQEQVDCLLDYLDTDEEPRPLGAEQDAYDFMIRNRPLMWTLEELLVVRSFTAQLVYGEDVNFNGLLDPNEDDADARFPPDDSNGQLDRGLKGLCTVWSYEYDVDNRGRPRRDINGDPRALSGLSLPRRSVEFLRVWKQQKKPEFKHPSELLGLSIEYQQEQRNRKGKVTGRKRVKLDSGINAENLDVALDALTARKSRGRRSRVRGLVNVNTASAQVLGVLLEQAELPAETAEAIVSLRQDLLPEEKATPAWLFTRGVLPDAADFKKIAPYLTARSNQYRFFVIGYAVPSGNYVLWEVVVDLAGNTPRIAYQRDLSRMSLPVPIDLDSEEIRY